MTQHPETPARDPSARLRLWSAIVAAAIVLALATVGTLAARADGNPDTTAPLDSATLQHAEQLYAKDCVVCHGVEGRGAGMPGMALPALDASSDVWQKSAFDLELLVRTGSGTMPGVGSTWSKDEIRAVLGLISTWWTPEQRAQHQAISAKSTP